MSLKNGFFAIFLALFWGFVWAACLQYTRWGRWLALYRTWITVVVGVGVNISLMFPVLPRRAWLFVAAVFSFSSIGIILRSIYNEYNIDATL